MALSRITAASIEDGTVVAADIDDGAVTGPKLGATSINANNIVNASITGDKIGVGQITANLFASGAVSTTSISNGNSNVSIASANSDVSIFTAGTKAAEFDSSANFQFNSGYGSVATAYGCRAWVNFNGTGAVAIRGSGNVSSITDNGTGDYTVNFTNSLPDANYAVSGSFGNNSSVFLRRSSNSPGTSSSALRYVSLSDAGNATDYEVENIIIVR